MAKVYYWTDVVPELDMECLIFSNAPKWEPGDEFYFDPDHPITEDKIIWIELVDNKFVLPSDATGLFYKAKNECFNELDRWDVSECTNMSYMFYDCKNLKNSGYYKDPEVWPSATEYLFDPYNWDTSNVTNMSHMFENCNSLNEFSLYSWDVGKVSDMSYMFSRMGYAQTATPITGLYIDTWDTTNVKNMSHMFEGVNCAENFTVTVNVSNWDVSNVEDFSYMFSTTNFGFNISNWDTSSAKSFRAMFSATPSTGYDISHLKTENADCSELFWWCGRLEEVNICNLDLSSTTTLSHMFGDCINLQRIVADPGTDWTQYPESQFISVADVFTNCYSLPNWTGNLDWTSANNTKSDGYFTAGPKTWVMYELYVKDEDDWVEAIPYVKDADAWSITEVWR